MQVCNLAKYVFELIKNDNYALIIMQKFSAHRKIYKFSPIFALDFPQKSVTS